MHIGINASDFYISKFNLFFIFRALKSSTAETPDMVSEFLNNLSAELKPRAEQDFQSMHRLKVAENPKSKVDDLLTQYFAN